MLRSLWLITKHDVGVILRQPTFWIFSFLVPVLLLGYLTWSALYRDQPASTGPAPDVTSTEPAASLPNVGLVDEAGLITQAPPGLPLDWPRRYADQAAARAALEAGEIEQYVYLPADYLAQGQVKVYTQEFQMLSSGEAMGVAYGSSQAWLLEYLIDFNLSGDADLLTLLRNPTPGSLAAMHALHPPPTEAADAPVVEWIAGVIPFAFYFLLMLSGSYLLRSVVAEKENRTAEVLLLSLPPRDLMLGKILAMSVILLLQLAVWAGGAALVFARDSSFLPAIELSFPPGFWLWTPVFLLLGYLLFASVMAAAGALAPNAREGGQAIMLLVLPLMPTIMFGPEIVAQPTSAFALFMTLFPFSAPSAMVTRLAVGPVPAWQIGLSLASLALSTWLFITWAGRFFRADNLLSSVSFSMRRLLTDWRG